MQKNRLEAFSDGVLAIVITIMVLELRVPEGATLADMKGLHTVLASYALSFIYIGIYWNNHHHMLHVVKRVTGGIMWANLNLLFGLSLMPFGTHWIGATGFAPTPMAIYGVILLLAGGAYKILQQTIIRTQGPESSLAKMVGRDAKGIISLVAYIVGAFLATSWPFVSLAIYCFVAVIWLVPDRRIERHVTEE